ncbi:MAG TPA: DUF4256 domain-containing protein [Tepidisphaeraceae bacterium]|nr:DUF4256 domain-containing protein [Tepidisphaeraceae bacterium]
MKNEKNNKKKLSSREIAELLKTLKSRFEKHMHRHKGIDWARVQSKLEDNLEKLWSLNEMEKTGGEPDVIGFDEEAGKYIFCDCSAESPGGRRSICYDREGQKANIKGRPDARDNAIDMAANMGIEVLTEDDFRNLQKLGPFDAKSSSWLKTPPEFRKMGGALFGDYRYGRVFIYHNGAQSYYGARAFRGLLRV